MEYYTQYLQWIRCDQTSKICYVKKQGAGRSIPYSLIYWDRVLGIHTNPILHMYSIPMERHTETVNGFFFPVREMSSRGKDGRETFHCISFLRILTHAHVFKK